MAKLILSMTNRILSSFSGMFYSPEKEAVSEINDNKWLEPNFLPDFMEESILYDPQYFIVGG